MELVSRHLTVTGPRNSFYIKVWQNDYRVLNGTHRTFQKQLRPPKDERSTDGCNRHTVLEASRKLYRCRKITHSKITYKICCSFLCSMNKLKRLR